MEYILYLLISVCITRIAGPKNNHDEKLLSLK